MRTMFRAITVAFLLGATSLTFAAEETKVLFVGKQPDHPFGSHMYLHTSRVLARCLAKTDGVTTQISNGWPTDEHLLDGVDTIVVYTSPAAEFLLDGDHRGQVDALMKQGVGLVTIHWASSIYQENFDRLGPTWLSYLGGTWISNVGLHTTSSPLQQLDPDHPISRGWDTYELHDEYYLNPTLTDDAIPLLEVTSRGEPVIVGWAYERPHSGGFRGGRSFATTLGHFYSNFQRSPFRRMVTNAILWTAAHEVPAGGADVALTEAELALPPNPAAEE